MVTFRDYNVGQYFYEKTYRGRKFYWLVMRRTEGGAIEVEKYEEDEKQKAIDCVYEHNGWKKK